LGTLITMVRKRRKTEAPVAADVLHHRVYVVRLAHPRHPDVPCYYVGMTGLAPEERLANHKAGVKAASVVRRYGVALAYEWFDDIPPMTFAEAALCEPTLADELRDRGFIVYGPTNRT
jgi:predicted GIY-YIG superfamily endonuclease